MVVAGVGYYALVANAPMVTTTPSTQTSSSPSLSTSQSTSSQSSSATATQTTPPSSTTTTSSTSTSSSSTLSTSSSSTTSSTSQTSTSSTSSTTIPNTACGTPTQGSATVTVGVGGAPGGFTFVPYSITVVIGVNNTVQWTNNDPYSIPHTVTSTTTPGPHFNSGNMDMGTTFTCSFTMPGTYNYHCLYHAEMIGVVIVKSP